MSLSVAPVTLLKQYSFPASALNDSAAPESARSATAVPTAASTLAAALGAPACSCVYACAGSASAANVVRTAGQYLRISHLGIEDIPKMQPARLYASKTPRRAGGA